MLGIVGSCCCVGMETHAVRVEVDVSPGLPSFNIVGLPDTAIRESTERVRSSIRNAGFDFPMKRITVNLAPADLRKEGSLFDLPIAIGILAATGQISNEMLENYLLVGELSLDGAVAPVPGVLLMACSLAKSSKKLVVPFSNLEEASLAQGPEVLGGSRLAEVVAFLRGEGELPSGDPGIMEELTAALYSNGGGYPDFADVKGQEGAKRALEIAAAGGHNILLVGPPGTGKTLLARRLPSIMPPLNWSEALEVTKIYSVAGLLPREKPLITMRPFRAPHHTASAVSIIGGGRVPHPGEVSFATHGILFFDELPEFNRDVLEALRQPLEERVVTVTRASGSCTFPAGFTFVGAMNPCPCGYLGDPDKACTCTPHQTQKYRSRISGPILDRIDLHVEVPRLRLRELEENREAEPSSEIRKRVIIARQVQQKRFQGEGITCNAQMEGKQIRKYCRLGKESRELLYKVFNRLHLSMRSFDRVLKVARTIADLTAAEEVESRHLAEAIQYRFLDRTVVPG